MILKNVCCIKRSVYGGGQEGIKRVLDLCLAEWDVF